MAAPVDRDRGRGADRPGDQPRQGLLRRPRGRPSSTWSSTSSRSATGSSARCTSGRPRWSAGRAACSRARSCPPAATTRATRSTRSGSPRARPTGCETATITFPSGRTADEVCPTELAVVAWAAQPRHAHVPPVAGPPRRRRPPGPAAHRPRPAAGHRLRATRSRRRRAARAARRARHGRLPEDLRRPRHARLRADRAALDFIEVRHARDRVRPRAGAADARTRSPVNWWKEERGERIFIDFNQNARDRTIASRVLACGRSPARPVSAPLTLGRARRRATRPTSPCARCRPGSPRSATCTRAIDDVGVLAGAAAGDVRRATSATGLGDMPYPPEYPKMPGEPPRVQPSRINPDNWPKPEGE